MKILNDKSWIMGKWIENQTLSEQVMEKYYDVFTDLLHGKKSMVCSYISKDGVVVSKAVYINFTENEREIWINTDESAELCQSLNSNKNITGYIFDEESVCGIMLLGEAGFEQQAEYIVKSWKNEFED